MVTLDQGEPSCSNHGFVVGLFVYGSSFQRLYLWKNVIKNAANLAAREH